MLLRTLALTLLLAPWFVGCAAPVDSAQEARPKELVVVVTGDAPGVEDRLREEGFFQWIVPRLEGWHVTVRSAGDGVPETGRDDALVVVAPLPASAEVQGLLEDLPVTLAGDRVQLSGASYDAHEVSLTLHLPGGGERWLVASADPGRLAGAADRVLSQGIVGISWRGESLRDVDYEVRAGRFLARAGTWRRGPDGREPDPASEEDDFAERERWLASLRPIDAGPVRLLVPPGREASAEMRALAADLGRTAAAVAPRVPIDPELLRRRPVTVAVEADHVAQIRHTGALGFVVAGWAAHRVLATGAAEPPDLHLVYHPDDVWAYRHAVARQLLERSAAAGASPTLIDGAALWLTGSLPESASGLWYGRPYPEWLPDLVAAEVLPATGELVLDGEAEEGDDRRVGTSEPLWVPVAASVVERLAGRTAADKLSGVDEATVEKALEALARRSAQAGAEESGAPSKGAPLPGGWLRGVSLAASLTLEGGYHAPGLAERLDRLAGLGANAVSLMPFASQRAPDSPELRFMNGSPTSETDTGLVHAARTAHRHGFTVLWKPHVWVGHDSWPGEVAMTSEEDWRAWWGSYRRYVLHHALLARYAGAEIFCVGVELEKTVERRADWEALIAAVRRIYPGALTYAANWGAGADRVSFWGALDAAGVDAYYPLAEGDAAGDQELRRGAEEVAKRLEAIARRSGKPLLLTEVGFPARRGAWREPHLEGGDLSESDQARSYRALLAALDRRPWLRGVFVWKAFSGERPPWFEGRPDFRFLDRPSEGVVAAFFRRVGGESGAVPGRP